MTGMVLHPAKGALSGRSGGGFARFITLGQFW